MLGWREIASWIIGAIAPDDGAVGICATTVVRSAQATVSIQAAEADASVVSARAIVTIRGGCDDCN